MPKMKTNAGAKKRFRITGTGKLKRKHAYHSHILTYKRPAPDMLQVFRKEVEKISSEAVK